MYEKPKFLVSIPELRSLQTSVHAASSVTSTTMPQPQLTRMSDAIETATPPPQCTALVAAQVI